MKSGVGKHFVFAFLIAAVAYVVCYRWLESRQTRRGPWQVTFSSGTAAPFILINQPSLRIQNVKVTFADQSVSTNLAETLVFDQPRPWPYEVPFGRCVFMDTMFLPGNVTFDLYGHEIQLLPRILTIDFKEIPWLSNTNILLWRTNTVARPPA